MAESLANVVMYADDESVNADHIAENVMLAVGVYVAPVALSVPVLVDPLLPIAHPLNEYPVGAVNVHDGKVIDEPGEHAMLSTVPDPPLALNDTT